MITNKEHYQITGDINADFGVTVSNPIIKIAVQAEAANTNGGILPCEYNVYISADAYYAGKKPFKADVLVNKGTEEEPNMVLERLNNIQYPASNLPFYTFALGYTTTPPTENALESQRKIIADTFGIALENVVLVEEV